MSAPHPLPLAAASAVCRFQASFSHLETWLVTRLLSLQIASGDTTRRRMQGGGHDPNDENQDRDLARAARLCSFDSSAGSQLNY